MRSSYILIALPLTANRARALSEALDDGGRFGGGPVLDVADPSDRVMKGIALDDKDARSAMVETRTRRRD